MRNKFKNFVIGPMMTCFFMKYHLSEVLRKDSETLNT